MVKIYGGRLARGARTKLYNRSDDSCLPTHKMHNGHVEATPSVEATHTESRAKLVYDRFFVSCDNILELSCGQRDDYSCTQVAGRAEMYVLFRNGMRCPRVEERPLPPNVLDCVFALGAISATWERDVMDLHGSLAARMYDSYESPQHLHIKNTDGNNFRGWFVDGLRQGQGTLVANGGKIVRIGAWDKGRQVSGTLRLTDTTDRDRVEYEGGFLGGKFEGTGELRIITGPFVSCYKGSWKNGLPDGEGEASLLYFDESTNELLGGVAKYKGGWKAGKRHGQGHSVSFFAPNESKTRVGLAAGNAHRVFRIELCGDWDCDDLHGADTTVLVSVPYGTKWTEYFKYTGPSNHNIACGEGVYDIFWGTYEGIPARVHYSGGLHRYAKHGLGRELVVNSTSNKCMHDYVGQFDSGLKHGRSVYALYSSDSSRPTFTLEKGARCRGGHIEGHGFVLIDCGRVFYGTFKDGTSDHVTWIDLRRGTSIVGNYGAKVLITAATNVALPGGTASELVACLLVPCMSRNVQNKSVVDPSSSSETARYPFLVEPSSPLEPARYSFLDMQGVHSTRLDRFPFDVNLAYSIYNQPPHEFKEDPRFVSSSLETNLDVNGCLDITYAGVGHLGETPYTELNPWAKLNFNNVNRFVRLCRRDSKLREPGRLSDVDELLGNDSVKVMLPDGTLPEGPSAHVVYCRKVVFRAAFVGEPFVLHGSDKNELVVRVEYDDALRGSRDGKSEGRFGRVRHTARFKSGDVYDALRANVERREALFNEFDGEHAFAFARVDEIVSQEVTLVADERTTVRFVVAPVGDERHAGARGSKSGRKAAARRRGRGGGNSGSSSRRRSEQLRVLGVEVEASIADAEVVVRPCDEPEADECPVCLDPLEEPMWTCEGCTKCRMHMKCAVGWFRTSTTCPNCRAPVDAASLE